MGIVGLKVHNENYCCQAVGGGDSMSTATLLPPDYGTGGLYIHNGIVATGDEKGGPNIHNGTIAAW